jgi:hypothetical protein
LLQQKHLIAHPAKLCPWNRWPLGPPPHRNQDALGPQAPSDGVEMAAPKPTKRKKKFLEADAGAVL